MSDLLITIKKNNNNNSVSWRGLQNEKQKFYRKKKRLIKQLFNYLPLLKDLQLRQKIVNKWTSVI